VTRADKNFDAMAVEIRSTAKLRIAFSATPTAAGVGLR
jgi:hypothetical protein